MLDAFLVGLSQAGQWQSLLSTAIGVIIGLVVGMLPGLTISSGIIIVLPLTFTMSPVNSISMLLGLYAAGMTGGSISAILLNIPGTPSASATGLDGYALTRQGMAGKALGTAVIASFGGGMFSLLCLVAIAPQLARVALRFGAPELFTLVVFGLASVCSFAQRSITKGLISAVLGLIIMTAGQDPVMGTPRFTFGSVSMLSGISFLPAMVGLFAIPQVLRALSGEAATGMAAAAFSKITGLLPTWQDIRKVLKTIGLGSAIGTGIGIIPGAAGPIAAFFSYDYARRISKDPGRFGRGALEGVAAPESANNGVSGGAMIPMLTLGIPGDPITALLIGALMIHGLAPGPLLFQEHADFVYTVFVAFLFANVFNLVIALLLIPFIVRVLRIPRVSLLALIALLCVLGTYALRNNFFDSAVMLFFGILGFFMQKYDIPVVPMILAIVLGPLMEEHLRVALTISKGDPTIFFLRPVSALFILMTAATILTPIIRRRTRPGAAKADQDL